MLKVIRHTVEEDVPQADLIVPSEAARVMGKQVQAVSILMELGKLPLYILPMDGRVHPQKFTSREAIADYMKSRKAKPASKVKRGG